jgi:hypothetical protein
MPIEHPQIDLCSQAEHHRKLEPNPGPTQRGHDGRRLAFPASHSSRSSLSHAMRSCGSWECLIRYWNSPSFSGSRFVTRYSPAAE